jgi:cytochrome bd-type quinol oxidase subunit 2
VSLTGHRAAAVNYRVNVLDLSRWQFLRLKTTGELRDRAARMALPVSAVAAVALIAAAAANWVRRAPEKAW